MTKPLPTRVVIRDLAKPESFRQKDINYNNRNDRQWLAKNSLWALDHNHSVLTYPI